MTVSYSRILEKPLFASSVSIYIYIYICVTGPQRPPSPRQWSWSPLPPVVWCAGMVVVQSLMLYKGCMNKYEAYLSVCRSKKGSMKRLEAKRVQWRDEAYLIAIVLQSISSPLWWWCAADIASKEGGKEERKKGREGERRERKKKGRRERRKKGKKKEGGKEEGRTKGSPPPLGLGGAGGGDTIGGGRGDLRSLVQEHIYWRAASGNPTPNGMVPPSQWGGGSSAAFSA